MYLSQTFLSSLGWGEHANLDKLLPLRYKQIPKTDYLFGIYKLLIQSLLEKHHWPLNI